MNPKNITAVKLIALGILVLAYTGITYAITGKPVTVLSAYFETTRTQFIIPLVGALALASGVGLLVLRPKQS